MHEVFVHLSKSNFSHVDDELKRFLSELANSFCTTAINEDCFQRCRTAEASVPTRRLSGDAAWAVPIRKRVLSDVYSFPELDPAACPAPAVGDKLPSTIYHSKKRDVLPREFLRRHFMHGFALLLYYP